MPRTLAHPKAPRHCIGFRLDEKNYRVLVERAAKFKGSPSPHELARFYLVQVLREQQERADLQHAIESLREDMLVAVEALLASAGQVSQAQANTWVKANFG